MPNFRLKLMHVLVRDGEADPVLSQFGEHVDECRRGEALELIDIDKEIFSRFNWGYEFIGRKSTRGQDCYLRHHMTVGL